ncbi:hypothetical protein CCH79_00021089, partial [Gambusia affinis]
MKVHRTTGFAPFQLMFGRFPRLPVDVIFKQVLCDSVTVDYKNYAKTLMSHLNEAEQDKQEEGYNRKVKGTHSNIGARVLLANKGERGKKKLSDKWSAKVYAVVDRNLQTHTYKLEDKQGNKSNLMLDISFLPVGTPQDEIAVVGAEEAQGLSDSFDALEERSLE